ncbi:MAG: hypothetical protein K9K88_04950 [Desulfobacterales bacterium]|nr:hypothetical protein [Desulfobacterales bacterium]
MEELKSLSGIFEPDIRSTAWFISEPESGKQRKIAIEDHHKWISEIALVKSVPEKIRDHFETAKNLLLYSWFVYRFAPVAERHALTSLEFALKEYFGESKGGLNRLLSRALKRELFSIPIKKHREAIKEIRVRQCEVFDTIGDGRPEKFVSPSPEQKPNGLLDFLRGAFPFSGTLQIAHG